MPTYDTVVWLSNALVLTALLAVVTWFVWRARGPRAGVRMVGVTLLPLAMYFTGLLRLFWMLAWQISAWAGAFVFRPSTWIGLALAFVAFVLIVGAGRFAPSGEPKQQASKPRQSKRSSSTGDPELDDIDAILKKHGIE